MPDGNGILKTENGEGARGGGSRWGQFRERVLASEREADGRGVGQGQRRNGEAEKRLIGGSEAGWCRKRPAARKRRTTEVEGRPRQEAANCVARTARLLKLRALT
jgi:hypothetical protein